MRVAAVAVAALLVLSGCNAFAPGGGGSDGDAVTPTLTPAPVPEAESLRTPTPTQTECLAPRVAADERTPLPPPATPAPLPTVNGTIDGATLVARHASVLANHSFALRIGATEIESMPGGAAFTYEGVSLGFESVQVFAVAGTVYRLHRTDAGVSVTTTEYRPGSTDTGWYLDALTGRDWLAERVGRYDYTQVGTRTWNGTEVRVLRDEFDGQALVGPGEAMSVNSTVLVDGRGVVRHVRHVRTIRRDEGDEIVETSEVGTFAVTGVGSVTVSRPEEFCVPGSAVVTATETAAPSTGANGSTATATPNASAGPFTAPGTTESATATASRTVTEAPAAIVRSSAATASGRTRTFAVSATRGGGRESDTATERARTGR